MSQDRGYEQWAKREYMHSNYIRMIVCLFLQLLLCVAGSVVFSVSRPFAESTDLLLWHVVGFLAGMSVSLIGTCLSMVFPALAFAFALSEKYSRMFFNLARISTTLGLLLIPFGVFMMDNTKVLDDSAAAYLVLFMGAVNAVAFLLLFFRNGPECID